MKVKASWWGIQSEVNTLIQSLTADHGKLRIDKFAS